MCVNYFERHLSDNVGVIDFTRCQIKRGERNSNN